MNQEFISNTYGKPKYFMWFLELIAMFFICMLVFQGIGAFLCSQFLHTSITHFLSNPTQSAQYVFAFKWLQLLGTTLGSFLVPALCFSYLRTHSFFGYFNIIVSDKLVKYGLAKIIAFSALPIITFIYYYNKQINFNYEWWHKLVIAENQAELLTKSILYTTTIKGFLFNMLVVALAPAIAEETFFRGAMQKHFQLWFKNQHIAIWLTAMIFSFIHFQFLGFFPRMFIGIVLGYLYYYSKNLLLPILAHFINNGLQVVLYFLYLKGYTTFDIDDTDNFSITYTILGTVVLAISFYILIKKYFQTTSEVEGYL